MVIDYWYYKYIRLITMVCQANQPINGICHAVEIKSCSVLKLWSHGLCFCCSFVLVWEDVLGLIIT